MQVQASVDFATDTLVSTFREAQVFARSGRVKGAEGEEVSQCYVVKMVKGSSPEAGLFTTSTDYVAVDDKIVDSCALATKDGWRRSDVISERIILIGTNDEENTYYFKPPFAQIFEEVNEELVLPVSQTIEFEVGAVDQEQWNRKVSFDLSTGTAKRLKTEL